MSKNLGKIKQVIGPVVDVEFEGDSSSYIECIAY